MYGVYEIQTFKENVSVICCFIKPGKVNCRVERSAPPGSVVLAL